MSKIFNNSELSFKDLRKICSDFVKKLGVKRIIFNNRGKYVKGTYNCFNKIMYINTDQTETEMLHALFHELGHHQAVQDNKWIDYHYNRVDNLSGEEIFEIENGIDKIAEKLWSIYVDCKMWGRYKYAYPKAQKQQIINEFIVPYNK